MGMDFLCLLNMYVWWRDINREGTIEGQHRIVQDGLRMGMILFIVSEIMFFFAFFGHFFILVLIPALPLVVFGLLHS